jgi:hypothetical protein
MALPENEWRSTATMKVAGARGTVSVSARVGTEEQRQTAVFTAKPRVKGLAERGKVAAVRGVADGGGEGAADDGDCEADRRMGREAMGRAGGGFGLESRGGLSKLIKGGSGVLKA